MKLDKLHHWIGIGANLGVLVGIVFLIVQIQQSNRIATGTAMYELYQDTSEFNRLGLTDESLRSLMIKLYDPNQSQFEPRSDEILQTAFFTYTWLTMWLAAESAYEQGLATEDHFQRILRQIEETISTWPGAQLTWETVLARSNEDTLVEQKIRESLLRL